MSERPKIFISAPADARSDVLHKILKAVGATVIDSFALSPGDPITRTLADKIASANGIIVVNPNSSPNVAFEMGMASALGKPVLVFVEPFELLPPFAHGYIHQQSSLGDSEVLRASLSRFVADLSQHGKRKQLPKRPKGTDSDTPSINSSMALHLPNWKQLPPQELENSVAELFKAIGFQVEQSDQTRDEGVDCVLWSDSLRDSLGSPILVEIKSGVRDPGHLLQSQEQLQRYLENTEARFGLLLYLDKHKVPLRQMPSVSTSVLSFEIEDFARRLQRHSIQRVLLAERNRIAHHAGEEA